MAGGGERPEADGGNGGGVGWSGCSWKRKKMKKSAEGRETFTVAYYRCSDGGLVVLATRGDAG